MKFSSTSVSKAACFLLLLICASSALAQSASPVRVTKLFNWSVPSPDPAGVVYLPGANALFITDSEVNEMALFSGSNLFQADLDGNLAGLFSTLDFSDEPTGITINPNNNHLFISMDNSPRRVFEIDPGSDGLYMNADDTITSFKSTDFNCSDAEGVTYDPQGLLHIACGVSDLIYTVDPGPNQLFDGVAPAGDDTVSSFDTSSLGITDPEGITYDNDSAALYIIGKPKNQLLHVTTGGQYIRTITLNSSFLRKPAGLSMGPSSLNNGAQSLYLVDRGVDNDSDPSENDGRLFEFALPSPSANQAPTIQISAPSSGEVFQPGDTVSFVASAYDAEDGVLSAAVNWHSNRDGNFGTGATFSTSSLSSGSHTITASVADSSSNRAQDVVQISIQSGGSSIVVESRIDSSSDDAEQRGPGGNTWTNGNDLELVYDKLSQIVGLRFNDLSIPAGADIEAAYIQFQADEVQSATVTLEIRAQDSDNAEPILGRKKNLTNRSTTSASRTWQPESWQVVGEAGARQRTADLSALVQEVVDRAGWSPGSSMLFLISGSGTDRRTAESFDSVPSAAPLLHIRYSAGSQAKTLASAFTVVDESSDSGNPAGSGVRSRTGTAGDIDDASVAPLTQVSTLELREPALATQTDSVDPDSSVTLGSRLSHGSDDAEEAGNGLMELSNSVLELAAVGDQDQYRQVGMRFTGLQIPRHAGILSAHVQFQAAGTSDELTFITLAAEETGNAARFNKTDYNISSRVRTAASIHWLPPAWSTPGIAGTDQRTPDLSTLVQRVVSGDEWMPGNSIAILLEGDGERLVETFEGQSNAAPELIVTYTLQNAAPWVDPGPNQQIYQSESAILNGNVMDDGLPVIPGALEVQWNVNKGPGSVSFSHPASLATSASFDATGTYQLLLTVSDGQLTTYAEVNVEVIEEGY